MLSGVAIVPDASYIGVFVMELSACLGRTILWNFEVFFSFFLEGRSSNGSFC